MKEGCPQTCPNYNNKPSWLLSTLAELEEEMQVVVGNLQEEDDADSFAERADNYYRKRPQLLNLLHDLYNRYHTLVDRYCHSFKHHNSHVPSSTVLNSSDLIDNEDFIIASIERPISITNSSYPDSDVESSLSFLLPSSSKTSFESDDDEIVSELMAKTVENEILLNELQAINRQRIESTRKMELQKSLLEVLESERMVLLSENARLGYKVAVMTEENRGMVGEAAAMKSKAMELARCVLRMREEQRVLEAKIAGLEKRKREYYEEMVRREEEKRVVAAEVCVEVEKLKFENARLREEAAKAKDGWWRGWWDRVKKLDLVRVPSCGTYT